MEVSDINAITDALKEISHLSTVQNVPGWTYIENRGGGNCFYAAIADAFNLLSAGGKHDWDDREVRRAVTGKMALGEYNTAIDVMRVPEVYPVTLAIACNTRVPEKTVYRYYYTEGLGKCQETSESWSLPPEKPVARIAFTGDHYKAVISEPAGFGASVPMAVTRTIEVRVPYFEVEPVKETRASLAEARIKALRTRRTPLRPTL
jgi:hypothetical protein